MTNGRFLKECVGMSKALLFVAEQVKPFPPRGKLVYDKKAALTLADELRDLADVVEEAAG